MHIYWNNQITYNPHKFRNFLVRILIQKDNTYNKVLKTNFIQKKQEKRG